MTFSPRSSSACAPAISACPPASAVDRHVAYIIAPIFGWVRPAAAAATCGSSAAQRSPSECTDLPVDELPDCERNGRARTVTSWPVGQLAPGGGDTPTRVSLSLDPPSIMPSGSS